MGRLALACACLVLAACRSQPAVEPEATPPRAERSGEVPLGPELIELRQEVEVTPLQRGQSLEVAVHARQADVADVCEAIGARVGRNILVDPRIDEALTLDLPSTPWREVVDVVAQRIGADVEERCSILLLTRPPIAITLSVEEANVREVLRSIAVTANRNLLLPPEVRGEVTLELDQVPWPHALRTVLAQVGPFEVDDGGDLIRIFSLR